MQLVTAFLQPLGSTKNRNSAVGVKQKPPVYCCPGPGERFTRDFKPTKLGSRAVKSGMVSSARKVKPKGSENGGDWLELCEGSCHAGAAGSIYHHHHPVIQASAHAWDNYVCKVDNNTFQGKDARQFP